MAVMRYKSTGNMLSGAEAELFSVPASAFARAGKRAGSREDEDDDYYSCSPDTHTCPASATCDDEEAEDEDDRRRPLLVQQAHQQQVGRNRSSSCKLLGVQRRRYEDEDQDEDEEQLAARYEDDYEKMKRHNLVELEPWDLCSPGQEHSKSLADFLLASMQRQQQQRDDLKLKHCDKQAANYGARSAVESEQVALRAETCLAMDTCERGEKKKKEEEEEEVLKGGANGARTRRRRSNKLRLASLSLSSPALSQRGTPKRRQSSKSPASHTELERPGEPGGQQCSVSDVCKMKPGRACNRFQCSLKARPVAMGELTNERSSGGSDGNNNNNNNNGASNAALCADAASGERQDNLGPGSNDKGFQLLGRSDNGHERQQLYGHDVKCLSQVVPASGTCAIQMPETLPCVWPSRQPDRRQQQQQQCDEGERNKNNNFYYAPTTQQTSHQRLSAQPPVASGGSVTAASVALAIASAESNNANGKEQNVHLRGANVGSQQQRLEIEKHANQWAPAGKSHLKSADSLMLDLNEVASTLRDTCANSWRQALHPSGHSATYKVSQVAQEQKVSLVSASGPDTSPSQLAYKSTREANSMANANDNSAELAAPPSPANNKQENNKRISRYSRPGRSPISLQRQTNARLAKHRLKIQQQRQEQLAQLAIRERHQLLANSNQQQQDSFAHRQTNNNNNNNNSSLGRRQQHEANSSKYQHHHHHPHPHSAAGHESLYLVNGLCDRLPLIQTRPRTPNSAQFPLSSSSSLSSPGSFFANQDNINNNNSLRGQQHEEFVLHDRTNNIARLTPHDRSRLAFNNFASQHQHQQHQVISPTKSRAIEICDNQLACSSRQVQPQTNNSLVQQQQTWPHTLATTSPNHFNQTPTSSGANVIVYKSINMLRDGPNGNGQQGRPGNNRGHVEEEEIIESDDAQTIYSSGSTLSLGRPFCKICHIGSTKSGDKLISPCRCSGTMQYIHCGCLLKWLEISNRTNEKPMSCELCAHEYTWHKKFNYKQMKMPKCSLKDIMLHMIFVAAITVMLLAAIAPMIHKKPNTGAIIGESLEQQTGYKAAAASVSGGPPGADSTSQQHRRHPSPFHHHATLNGQANHLAVTGRLASDEKYMLICAATFFITFFLAIYVQTKTRDTLYGLLVKFLAMNQTYYITEYDHGQLIGNNNSNNNSNVNNSKHQQYQCGEDFLRADRKNSEKS